MREQASAKGKLRALLILLRQPAMIITHLRFERKRSTCIPYHFFISLSLHDRPVVIMVFSKLNNIHQNFDNNAAMAVYGLCGSPYCSSYGFGTIDRNLKHLFLVFERINICSAGLPCNNVSCSLPNIFLPFYANHESKQKFHC